MSRDLIRIDLWRVLRQRMGKNGKFLPHWAVRPLERLVRQRELNETLEYLYPRRGSEFCEALLKRLDIKLQVRGIERLPQDGRCIFVSNHPLGGLDGICLIAFLAKRYGVEPEAVVNDLLMAVEPLRDNFVPINKYGSQGRGHVNALNEAFAGERPMIYFPAGLVSRLQPDGSIADLKWQKNIVNKAIEYNRPIVPLYFDGRNHGIFYKAAKWRKSLKIKFNVELVLLPRELFLGRGSRFGIYVGEPIAPTELKGGADAAAEIEDIRTRVYSLSANSNSEITEII